ncbi:hypothetical protein B7P43_G11563 [Cryptotermes secundus]|uniref:Endonuclease/exonuclease/phosphatase domain-containing protein n=1 Tax=Cryptotermes secundus TaxID=105785 RepID=A0A2J7RL74_9NEOP|nr:hypothetical protein B7P43_G11563 [Cryptotermes secundus]
MLIGYHYFSPDTKPEVITGYFQQLENILDTNNTRVILLGDFNAPGFNWENETPISSCHYYSKLKGDSIYTSTCFLGLWQCVEAVDIINMFDPVFANFTQLKYVAADSGLVAPDIYHPPLNIDVLLPNVNSNLNCEFSYQNFAAGNYALLYNILSTYDWSSVYETSSVDVAVASLSVALRSAMEQVIPCGYRYKSKYPHWFSYTLRYYITKKNCFHRRFKKKPSDCFYGRFAYYRKLVKNTIKSDRLRWLKSLDNNLKSQPQHFWKYVSNFRKHRSGFIHLEVGGTHLVQPEAVADAFARHFQSVYNNHCSKDIHPLSPSSEFLSLAPISDADVCKAFKRLKPSKSVGLDDIPGFVIKGGAGILTHIFNLSLEPQCFHTAWKESAVVPVFKRGNHAAVTNQRPISILSNFSKLFEFIIHDHVSHFAEFNCNQHGFTRTKYTVTNLVTFLYFSTS